MNPWLEGFTFFGSSGFVLGFATAIGWRFGRRILKRKDRL